MSAADDIFGWAGHDLATYAGSAPRGVHAVEFLLSSDEVILRDVAPTREAAGEHREEPAVG